MKSLDIAGEAVALLASLERGSDFSLMGSCKELPVGPKHLIHKLLDKLVLCPLHFFTSSGQINPLSTSALFSPLSLSLCRQELVFCSSALWALPAVCVQMELSVTADQASFTTSVWTTASTSGFYPVSYTSLSGASLGLFPLLH